MPADDVFDRPTDISANHLPRAQLVHFEPQIRFLAVVGALHELREPLPSAAIRPAISRAPQPSVGLSCASCTCPSRPLIWPARRSRS